MVGRGPLAAGRAVSRVSSISEMVCVKATTRERSLVMVRGPTAKSAVCKEQDQCSLEGLMFVLSK